MIIEQTLNKLGYSNFTINKLKDGSSKVIISGEVFVQEIKDNFEVIKWDYEDRKVMFVMK